VRDDFFEVLIERPRTRPWRRKRRSLWHRLPEAERPRCESMSRARGGDKHLTDLLGPLRRFLRARAGRPFDEVMSEVHARISAGSYLQRHLLEHLERMAEPDADGRLVLTGRWG
jgi:hypothetical protein